MKVLLINGSPHVKGCTARALREVADALNECGIETRDCWIGVKPLPGCMACGHCQQTGQCVFTDTVNQAAQLMQECDGLVVGTPVYYASPNGALLSFLDRLFFSAGPRLAFKPAAAIASSRRAGSVTSMDVINKYFTINNMPVVSSQYWNEVHGFTPDDVEQDLEGLQTMRMLGRNMAWLLRAIDVAKQHGVEHPPVESPHHTTNFIR